MPSHRSPKLLDDLEGIYSLPRLLTSEMPNYCDFVHLG